jgi:hypothetical protein
MNQVQKKQFAGVSEIFNEDVALVLDFIKLKTKTTEVQNFVKFQHRINFRGEIEQIFFELSPQQ